MAEEQRKPYSKSTHKLSIPSLEPVEVGEGRYKMYSIINSNDKEGLSWIILYFVIYVN